VARIVRDFNKKKVAQQSAGATTAKKTPAKKSASRVSSAKTASAGPKVQAKAGSPQPSE